MIKPYHLHNTYVIIAFGTSTADPDTWRYLCTCKESQFRNPWNKNLAVKKKKSSPGGGGEGERDPTTNNQGPAVPSHSIIQDSKLKGTAEVCMKQRSIQRTTQWVKVNITVFHGLWFCSVPWHWVSLTLAVWCQWELNLQASRPWLGWEGFK